MAKTKTRDTRNHKIIALLSEGKTVTDIARDLDMDRSYLSKLINTDEMRAKRAKFETSMQDKVRDEFTLHAVAAARKIVALSKKGTSKERMQFDAAKEVLYQIGCKPKETVEQIIRDYTPQEIEKARKTMDEIADFSERLSEKKSRFLVDDTQETKETKEPGDSKTAKPSKDSIPDEGAIPTSSD